MSERTQRVDVMNEATGMRKRFGFLSVVLSAVFMLIVMGVLIPSFSVAKIANTGTNTCSMASCHPPTGVPFDTPPTIEVAVENVTQGTGSQAYAGGTLNVNSGDILEIDWKYNHLGSTGASSPNIWLPTGWTPSPGTSNAPTVTGWDAAWDAATGESWNIGPRATDSATAPAGWMIDHTISSAGWGNVSGVAQDDGLTGDLDLAAQEMGGDVRVTVAGSGLQYIYVNGSGKGKENSGKKDTKGSVQLMITLNVAGGADTTAPTSAITAPTGGVFLSATDFPYAITGTASDVGGNVALVEVDINSAGTWPDATDTGAGTWSTWSYSWAQPADGSYTIQSRATDDAGVPNVETPVAGVTVTVDATAPTLTSTDPANSATDVALDQNVTITFNEVNLDCTTVTTGTITSAMPGWTLSTCNDVTGVAVFATTGQANSTTYDFTITAGVADKAGNTYAGPTTISYTTIAPGNTNPNNPTGLLQFKSDGLASLASGDHTDETTVVIEADISDSDVADTIMLQVDIDGNGTVDCQEAALGANNRNNVQVSCTGLVNGTSYDWQVRVQDNSGANSGWVAFPGSPDFTVDTVAPTLTSTDPANSATGVTVDQNVTITFNEANLDCTTVTAGTITSAMPGWTLDSCTEGTGVAVFTTTGQAGSAPYSFTITSGVADKAGNTYAGPTVVSYTTGAVCSRVAPFVNILTASKDITVDGGFAVYTVEVTNNDNAICGNTTFNLSVSDDNPTNFYTPTLVDTSLVVPPGNSAQTTFRVTARANQPNTSADVSDVTAGSANHADVTSGTVTTTINVAGGGCVAAGDYPNSNGDQFITSR